jgi:hypothetical protein
MTTLETTATRSSQRRRSKFRENLFPACVLLFAVVGIFTIITRAIYLMAAMFSFYNRIAASGYKGFETPAELVGFMLITIAVGAAADRLLIHLANQE